MQTFIYTLSLLKDRRIILQIIDTIHRLYEKVIKHTEIAAVINVLHDTETFAILNNLNLYIIPAV